MNILIIKQGALGDVIMATPLITAIQHAYPDDKIFLLTTKPFDDIFRAWQGLQVAALPRRGVRNTLRTIRFIRQQNFAQIFDLQSNDRTRVLCAFSKCSIRVGNHRRFPYTHYPATRWAGQSHIFERLREVLGSANIDDVPVQPMLPATAQDREHVSSWLAKHSLGERDYVILHANASTHRQDKVWPNFVPLAHKLIRAGLCPVWVGATQDSESNRCLADSSGGINGSGEFTIAELAELGRHARFAVTNDSGPMHVLSCSSIPIFGLFGPTDWRRNHAIGQRHNVIACVECVAEFQGAATGDCLERISAEMVCDKIAALNLM